MAKIIRQFNIDISNIPAKGESRPFSIVGDEGAGFYLFIKNEDNSYYNFVSRKFQSQETYLQADIKTSSYKSSISFPPVTDADQYDFYLLADPNLDSQHGVYLEVRDEDGSINVNQTTGSDSLFLRKIIYQTLNATLTIDTVDTTSGAGFANFTNSVKPTVTTSIGGTSPKISFTTVVTANLITSAFSLNRQPSANDFVASIDDRTIGVISPTGLAGETTDNRFGFTIDNAADIEAGMIMTGANVTANTIVSEGREEIIELENTVKAKKRPKVYKKAIEKLGPIKFVRDATTKIVTRTFGGVLNFNKGQADALESDNDVVFYAYGSEKIKKMTGWDIEISNLKATITSVSGGGHSDINDGILGTAVTAQLSSNSFTVQVARGIQTNVTKISSINMPDTLVTSVSNWDEPGNDNKTAAIGGTGFPTFEIGELIRVKGSGQDIAITGDIKVNYAAGDASIFLDISRFIRATVESA